MSDRREQSKDTIEDDEMLVGVDDNSMTGDGESSVANLSIAKKETKAVAVFRVILLVALVALAVGVSLIAFFFSKNGEIEDFETTFEGHALKVSASCEWSDHRKRSFVMNNE